MPKALITVFFNAQIFLAKFTISGTKAFVDEGSFKNGDSFKNSAKFTHRMSQTASSFRRVALRRPGGAAAVFFFRTTELRTFERL